MSSRPLLVAVERCQLCGRTKKQFSCTLCITSGNFVLSSERRKKKDGDTLISFADKEKRLKVVVAVCNEYHHRVASKIETKSNQAIKQNELIRLKDRIETLKTVVNEIKTASKQMAIVVEEVSSKVDERKLFIKRLHQKTQKLVTSNRWKEQKIKLGQYKEKLIRKNDDLKEQRLFHVKSLINDIFPLSQREVYPEFGTPPRQTIATPFECGDVVSEMLSTTEQELEEATRTVHVGGRWVSQSSTQTEHTIVEIGMPSTDEFYKYFEWIKSYRNEPRNPESQPPLHDIAILRIPSALMYTAQLADLLAFFLDVNLPNKVDYLHFGLLQVSRQRLYQTINKLSQNIMYLGFSQLVPLSEMQPRDLLKNLKICVDENNALLGWFGPFETYECNHLDCSFDSDSSAEELNYDSDSTVSVEQEDWDKLMDFPADSSDVETPSTSHITESNREQSITSSASGLVTSAAASLASALWSLKRQ